MENHIKLLQDVNNKAISWVNAFLEGGKREKSLNDLTDIRREIKRIIFALDQNPSAAVYGESQVGKSYLIKNLLSTEGNEFKVDKYNFLEEINPQGGGVEATSVVTRFSTKVDVIDEDFPIKIRLFSPKDIALVLIDSCSSELRDTITLYENSIIVEKLKEVNEKYQSGKVVQEVLTEDDMYDIRDYIFDNFKNSRISHSLTDTNYWKIVPSLINKVPVNEWNNVIGIIWGGNENISLLFKNLIEELEKLNFISVCYCGYEAVLRKYGTLLDVNRLHQINNEKSHNDASEVYKPTVDIVYNLNGAILSHTINKSYLCALTAELIFKVDEGLQESKAFLKRLDLLDFPGARARKELKEDTIKEEISSMILRGKVAYIFNKYSSEYLISNLLFCNRSEKIEVGYIPRLLDSWISRYIGATPEERERILNKVKVPPLFIIYTWFNTDLAFSSINDVTTPLESKWQKRFVRIFQDEIVSENYKWDKEWTLTNKHFKNNYLLRDMRLSEEKSNIFKGFAAEGKEISRNEFPSKPDYWRELENSFLNFPFVKNYFENPPETWRESATLNQDGTAPILRSLNIASESPLRIDKFNSDIHRLHQNLLKVLDRHFHSDDADNAIKKACDKGSRLHAELDIAFRDPYFFSKMMKMLLLSENEVFTLYHDKIKNLEQETEKDYSAYHAIKVSNPNLSHLLSFEENLDVLIETYSFLKNREECINYYENQNIDLQELFYGDSTRLKNNSEILAEMLETYWFGKLLNENTISQLQAYGLSGESVYDLFDNFKTNYKKLELSNKIAHEIRNYVDLYYKISEIEEMIADISSAIINKFVNTMGNAFITAEDLENLKKTNEQNNLGLNFDQSSLKFESLKDSEIEDLFIKIENVNKILNNKPIDLNELKNIPIFSNFISWRDLMKISFVANCDIPTYDILANNQLGEIIEKIKNVNV